MKKFSIEDVFFVLLLGFIFLITMPMHLGFSIYDESEYIFCAVGRADHYSYFWNRLGTWVPVSIVMKIFGYYGKNLTYVPTFCFLVFLSGVYAALRRWDMTIGLFAVAILGCTRFLLQNASTVNSDIMITIMANAPVLVYFAHTVPVREKGRRDKWWGAAAGVLFLIAFVTKESIAFYVPLLAILSIRDFIRGRYSAFWMAMALVSALGAIGICTFYWYATGDFFQKIHICATHFNNYCTYAHSSKIQIIRRLSYQPFQFLLENYGFGLLLLFSILNFLRKSNSEETWFFKIFLLCTLGTWWLCPRGGGPWNPIELVHRQWLPLIVPLALNTACILPPIIRGTLSRAEKIRMAYISVIFLSLSWLSLYFSYRSYLLIHAPQNFYAVGVCYGIVVFVLLIAILTDMGIEIMIGRAIGIVAILFAGIRLSFLIDRKKEDAVQLPPGEKMKGPYYIFSKRAFVLWIFIGTNAFGLVSDFSRWYHSDRYSLYDGEHDAVIYTESLHPPAILADQSLTAKYHIYDGFGKDYPFLDWGLCAYRDVPQGACLLINKERRKEYIANISEAGIYTKSSDEPLSDFLTDYAIHPEKYGFYLIAETESNQIWIRK